jgi:hypothetical protein
VETNVYAPPPGYTEEIRVRVTGDTKDGEVGLNRAEHLRAIPPSDQDFRALFTGGRALRTRTR